MYHMGIKELCSEWDCTIADYRQLPLLEGAFQKALNNYFVNRTLFMFTIYVITIIFATIVQL